MSISSSTKDANAGIVTSVTVGAMKSEPSIKSVSIVNETVVGVVLVDPADVVPVSETLTTVSVCESMMPAAGNSDPSPTRLTANVPPSSSIMSTSVVSVPTVILSSISPAWKTVVPDPTA